MSDRLTGSSIWFLRAAAGADELFWRPRVDIYRSGDRWLIKMELAGINPADLSIVREGNRLTVSGQRRDALAHQHWNQMSMEIAYARFMRVIDLPCCPDRAIVRAQFQEGMLLLFVDPEETYE